VSGFRTAGRLGPWPEWTARLGRGSHTSGPSPLEVERESDGNVRRLQSRHRTSNRQIGYCLDMQRTGVHRTGEVIFGALCILAGVGLITTVILGIKVSPLILLPIPLVVIGWSIYHWVVVRPSPYGVKHPQDSSEHEPAFLNCGSDDDAMKARWSDAWLLAAVDWSGGGDLAKIIGAADAINHAIPTDEEIEHSIRILDGAGLVRYSDDSAHFDGGGKPSM
jgi:hypothetical protein